MENSPTVLYSVDGPVARITLNRPERINALNIDMRDELFETLQAFAEDAALKLAVISGAGERGFCAGADLVEFGSTPSQAVARRARQSRDLWGLLARIRKPLVIALHGYVIGAGVEIACLCDIRIASQDTMFSMPEVTIGMIPGAGGTQTFPRAIGTGRAMSQFLADRENRMTAEEALATGLVHRVVQNSELQTAVMETVQRLLNCEHEVLTAIKTAAVDGLDMPVESGLSLERRLTVGRSGYGSEWD